MVKLGMVQSKAATAATVAAFLLGLMILGACAESNPQPSPAGGGDTGNKIGEGETVTGADLGQEDAMRAPDTAADVAMEEIAADGAGDATADDVPGEDGGDTVQVEEIAGELAPFDELGDWSGDVPVQGEVTVDGEGEDTTSLVEIDPTCVNVPFLVTAGEKIPIGFFSSGVSCASFDHAETYVEGGKVKVTVYGKKLAGECPPCIFYTVGMVWIEGLPPGPYYVKVGSAPAQYMVASAGDIPEIECQDDCVTPPGDGWEVTYVAQNPPMITNCGYESASGAVWFEGSCQDFVFHNNTDIVPSLVPVPDLKAKFCTETDLFFGAGEIDPSISATRCKDPWGPGAPVSEMILVSTGEVMGIVQK